jgi:hypothetical protein
MSTSVDNKPKAKAIFLDAIPFLKIQKFVGFTSVLVFLSGLIYLTDVNVNLMQKIMMYPSVNLWFFSASAFLFGYLNFVILQESWYMKEKVGLELFEDTIQTYCFDWSEKQIYHNEIKTIVISTFFVRSQFCWVKIEKHNGEKISIPVKSHELLFNALPEALRAKVKYDTSTFNGFLASGFLLLSLNLVYDATDLFFWLLFFFYCVLFLGFCFFVIFKKIFSTKKILRRELEVGVLLLIPALFLNIASSLPLSELDRLFYDQLHLIQSKAYYTSLSDKIQLCEHVKSNYLNLKPSMMRELDRVCSKEILEISLKSNEELEKAFDWAYAEYVKKQDKYQVLALACLYAETNQHEFAIQLASKHHLNELASKLKKGERCELFTNRNVASLNYRSN